MKKLLALVLAMVMTLGLATVGTGAAYSDAADIDYTEAVDVMTAIEVFDGMDGAFQPDGTLTREQAAKIIAYMILGKKNADSLSTAAAPFADVAADRWSAGSIAYAASEGIISGVGDGKFDPAGTLTGYAFAKMCLVALGYNAEYEQFVGSDWTINVGKAAASAGLNDNLNIVMSQPITRQEACQMALNTLKGDMVDYDNPINVKGADGMEVTVGADRYYLSLTTYDYQGRAATDDGRMQFVERYYRNPALTLDDDATDDFGRPADGWKLGNKSVGEYAVEPTLTYTKGVKGGDLYNDLGKPTIANKVTVAFASNGNDYANGYDTAAFADSSIAYIVSGDTHTIGGTGNGVKTEVYYSATKGTLSIVEISTFLAKAQADYDSATKKLSIQIDNTAPVPRTTTLSVEDWPIVESVKKDAYLYLTITDVGATDETIQSVELVPANAFVVAATVSAFKAGTNVTAGGTTYSVAAQNKNSKSSHDLILDPYGYLLAADVNTEGTTAADKYLWLDTAVDSGVSKQARVILADGTVATPLISKITYNSLTASGTAGTINDTYTVTNAATVYNVSEVMTSAAATTVPVVVQALYSYKVNSDGSYSLTYASSGATAATTLAKNQATVSGVTLNSKTALIASGHNDANYDDVQAFLGVANFPSVGSAPVFYALDASNSYAVAAYSAGAVTASSSAQFIYIFSGATKTQDTKGGDEYYTYDAFVDGELTTIKEENSGLHQGVYKVTQNNKGLYTMSANAYIVGDGAPAYAVSYATEVSVSNNVLTVKGDSKTAGSGAAVVASYTVNSDTVYYWIDNTTKANSRTLTSSQAGTVVNSLGTAKGANGEKAVYATIVVNTDTGAVKTVFFSSTPEFGQTP